MTTHEFHRKPGFEPESKRKYYLSLPTDTGGQSCPEDCPRLPDSPNDADDPLGTPLTLNAAAKLIGCSAWTLRQSYLPAGLPHLRSGPNGKFIFYRNQVIHWLLVKQQKGGIRA